VSLGVVGGEVERVSRRGVLWKRPPRPNVGIRPMPMDGDAGCY